MLPTPIYYIDGKESVFVGGVVAVKGTEQRRVLQYGGGIVAAEWQAHAQLVG